MRTDRVFYLRGVRMITLDRDRCTKCGTCISIGHGYCISDQDGYPVFNSTVCNVCQKCVAVCPSQAIMVNSMYPERISERSSISPEELVAFFETRRSTKLFQDRPIAEGELEMIEIRTQPE